MKRFSIILILSCMCLTSCARNLEPGYNYRINATADNGSITQNDREAIADILDSVTGKYSFTKLTPGPANVIRLCNQTPELMIYLACTDETSHIKLWFGPMKPVLKMTAKRKEFIRTLIKSLETEFGERLKKVE
ncbi:MAG: hypothetical protein AB7U43_10840 [Desulfobacter sp.]